MFGKHLIIKLVAALAVAVALAALGARMAKAGNPYNPQAYVYGGAAQTGGSAREVSLARRAASKTQSFHLITDTLGGNGYRKVVVHFKQESVRMIPDIVGDSRPKLPVRTLLSVHGFGLITDTLGGNGQLPARGGSGRTAVA